MHLQLDAPAPQVFLLHEGYYLGRLDMPKYRADIDFPVAERAEILLEYSERLLQVLPAAHDEFQHVALPHLLEILAVHLVGHAGGSALVVQREEDIRIDEKRVHVDGAVRLDIHFMPFQSVQQRPDIMDKRLAAGQRDLVVMHSLDDILDAHEAAAHEGVGRVAVGAP